MRSNERGYSSSGEDLVVWFGRQVRPYLFVAFTQWLNCLAAANPQATTEAIEEWGTDISYQLMFVTQLVLAKFAGTFEDVAADSLDIGSLLQPHAHAKNLLSTARRGVKPELNQAVTIDHQIPSEFTKDQVLATIGLWFKEIMFTKPWFYQNSHQFFINISEHKDDHLLLPKRIEVQDKWALQRYFDIAYMPVGASEEVVRAFYDEIAQDFESVVDMELKREVIYTLFAWLSLMDLPPTELILDLGCGTGLAERLKPKKWGRLIGLDFSQAMVSRASLIGETVAQASVLRTPFDDQIFRYVLMSFVDHYFEGAHKESLWREIYRLLKPEGVIVTNLHQPANSWQESYRALLSSIGFTTVELFDKPLMRQDGGSYVAHYLKAVK